MSDTPKYLTLKQLIWYCSIIVGVSSFIVTLAIARTNIARDIQVNATEISEIKEEALTREDVRNEVGEALEQNNKALINDLIVTFDERYEKKK